MVHQDSLLCAELSIDLNIFVLLIVSGIKTKTKKQKNKKKSLGFTWLFTKIHVTEKKRSDLKVVR